MASNLGKIVADFTTSLAASVSVGATSATLQSATDDDGNALPAGTYYFAIDADNANKEYIKATLSGTSLSSISSISRQGGSTSGFARAHRVGASAVLTDFAQLKLLGDLLSGLTDLDAANPLKYDGDPTITDNAHLATKKYADELALSGAPDATTTQKGMVEEATEAEINAGTAAGTTARLGINPATLATSNYGTRLPSVSQKEFLGGVTGMIFMYGSASTPTGFLTCDGSAVSRTTYAALFAIIGTSFGSGNGSTTFNVPDFRSSFPLGNGTRVRTMTFDGASAVDPTTDQIIVSSNDWLTTGQAVALTGSSLPTGLSTTTYYVIRVDATTIKLASSLANAIAGTAVDITADGSGTCTVTQTLTARSLGVTGGEESHALTTAEIPSHSHTLNIGITNSAASRNVAGSLTENVGDSTGSAGGSGTHNNIPPYTVVHYIIKT